MTNKSISLSRAHVKSARKTIKFKPQRKTYSGRITSGSVHALGSSKVYRVADDVIAVTDGSCGYLPFHLSELQAVLKEAKRLPIVTEFRCDK